jgi:hypothetical protein
MITMFGRPAALRVGTSDIKVTAVVLDYSTREVDGALIERGDLRVLITATAPIAPDAQNQRLVIDGKVFRIVNVRPLSPGGTVVYWDLQVRR